ncbi:ATP-dependent DNA helicase [Phaeovibrio sulfidiphilus]|uniref:ATP-dependent DNA helicase n=1 Tax=Phaeovibrio sulfidiphilus TaxID=1220600 RepID=A0A8J7CNT1_9PROT|nr:ATP-dependent DNA helicase [Phaeovibrio sulfidiphilus]MBE1236257.1 ATP-dependent DNA helicase [Phaeovibrio sulfidiphilus]
MPHPPDHAPVYPPPVPALAVGAEGGVLVFPGGEIETVRPGVGLQSRIESLRPMVCHRLHVARRLGLSWFPAFDLMELFAFACPAEFASPTPGGLARALGTAPPDSLEAEALVLPAAAMALFARLARTASKERETAVGLAEVMGRGGWEWTFPVLQALGAGPEPRSGASRAFAVWSRLPEIPEFPPLPPPGNLSVTPDEARARLKSLLGADSEHRVQQADYTSAVCPAFTPGKRKNAPNVVLAEAGTGVGKTLGYIAPSSLWAEKNGGAVWISTYTRNLQRQLDQELDRLYPDPVEKARHVVVRKGRENYLCLLNLEEAVRRIGASPREAVPLGLMARWAEATRDGDMMGGDFPGWLADLAGRERTLGLADRRGECIFSGCDHFNRCFVERAVRRAGQARLVVANHALVLVQAALGGLDDDSHPTRYVFDEGHHLFDAADSAFAVHVTAQEGMEMRRWLLGAEDAGARSRGRGLKRRAEGLFEADTDAAEFLDDALAAASVLPSMGWQARLAGGSPLGPLEALLGAFREQVHARARDGERGHSLETEVVPASEALVDCAPAAREALEALFTPLQQFSRALLKSLDAEAETLDSAVRHRIESLARSLEWRVIAPLRAWRDIVRGLGEPTPDGFVDWLAVERSDGQELDVGLCRHWIDPTRPLAGVLSRTAQGVVITSATLRDLSANDPDPEASWRVAECRTGAIHLEEPAIRAAVASPYDYPSMTRVLIVTDVARDVPDRVASAVSALFRASGGGGLGLFTAVSRLRAVYDRIAPELARQNLPLYAQHVDAMDTGTLVSIFREEENSCLLGTDAVRDGVDVPGRSLRLIVFDRVPWPRPDILHKARRDVWGKTRYDDRITRLRLKQAFGRLVRSSRDRGVFVMLDSRTPSRLLSAFPPGVVVERVGLAEAVAIVRAENGGAPREP